MEFDYDQLSHTSLALFVREVNRAIEAQAYDLILGGGDSGNIMVWITQEVYVELQVNCPDTLVLPTYRHADYAETVLFDNRLLKELVHLPNGKLKHILLVDDEVGTGNTIRGILGAVGELTDSKPVITFIAEDDGFDSSRVTGWDVDFRPPQPKVKDVYNAVSYIVPFDYEAPVKRVLEPAVEDLNDKHVMVTLLDLPIKLWNNGSPIFTYQYRDLCLEEIPGFADIQQRFQDFMREQVRDVLPAPTT